jgi:hypothetical protein
LARGCAAFRVAKMWKLSGANGNTRLMST